MGTLTELIEVPGGASRTRRALFGAVAQAAQAVNVAPVARAEGRLNGPCVRRFTQCE